MSIESTNTLAGLVATNPTAQDPVYQGPNHIWLIKSVLKHIFPGETGTGFSKQIIATEDEINRLDGVTAPVQTQLNTLRTDIDNILAALGQDGPAAVTYELPIGFLFHCAIPTNPNTLLGYGTWSRYGQGRMLISQTSSDPDFASAGLTGGSKTTQLPAHTHTVSIASSSTAHGHSMGTSGDHSHAASSAGMSANATHSHTGTTGSMSANSTHTHTASTGGMSGNSTHSHSATSGGMSGNTTHTHTASTGGMSANDTHSHSGYIDNSAGHTHEIATDWRTIQQGTGGTYVDVLGVQYSAAVVTTNTGGVHSHGATINSTSVQHTHTVSVASTNLDHTHSLTVASANIDHTHTVTMGSASIEHTHSINTGASSVEHTHAISVSPNGGHTHGIVDDNSSHTHTGTVSSTGSSDPNNLPPYIVVYIWQRIA